MPRRRKQKKGKGARLAQRERERAQTQGAREDVNRSRLDAPWGTSPGSLGRIKMESEEAKLLSCPECGHSGGRHSMACPFK